MKIDAMGWIDDGSDAPSRMDWGVLPRDINALGYRKGGDITGGGGGAGAGDGIKARRKWKGAGIDKQAKRAAKLARQAERWPWIAAAIESEEREARELVAIGHRLAQRAFKWVCCHRNIKGEWVQLAEHQRPSQTSIEEAAAVATASLAHSLAVWRGLGCAEPRARAGTLRRLFTDWQGCGCDPMMERDKARALPDSAFNVWREITLQAWAAARQSLTTRADGMWGRHAQDGAGNVDAVPLVSPSQSDLASLAAAAESGALNSVSSGNDSLPFDLARQEARTGAARWAWLVLVSSWARKIAPELRELPENVAKLKAARARARVIVRLIHGDSFADASNAGGFTSARAAIESLRVGDVFGQLERAACSSGRSGAELARAREAERLWRARARYAVLQHRAIMRSARWVRRMALPNSQAPKSMIDTKAALRESERALNRWLNARAVRIAAEARQNTFWREVSKGWRSGFNR